MANLQFIGFCERLWLTAVKGSHVVAQAFGVAKPVPKLWAVWDVAWKVLAFGA